MDFWFDFGANLAPFYPPKSTKILQKSDPKSHQNFDRFLLRFFLDSGSVLGTKLEPCWPPFSSQDAPRRPKDGHKTPQDAPKTAKDTPRRPKTTPRRPLVCLWYVFGICLDPLDLDFGPSRPRFLDDFGKIFGRLLDLHCLERRGRFYFFHTFRFSAVAGSQLCCAVGSAAPGLVPAHGVQNPVPDLLPYRTSL